MICSSISVFVYLCTARGRLGRFGGGGSALREVEPLELLVSPFLESALQAILIPGALQIRGHDNVHDDMNMYVIMHDQCLFIAMINIVHI